MIAMPQRRTLPFVYLVLPMLIARPSLDRFLGLGRIKVGPISLTPGFLFNVAFVAVAGVLMLHAFLVDRRLQSVFRTAATIWVPFLVAAIIAAAHTPVPSEAMQALFNYLTFAAVSFLALYYAPYLGRRSLTFAVALSGVIPLVAGLIQTAIGDTNGRLEASFTHPNIFAFYLMIYISFLYHAQISAYVRRGWQWNAIWVLIAIAGVELLLTGTRSAFVATALFLVVYSMFRRPLYLIPLLLVPPLAMLVPGVMARVMDAAKGPPEMSYAYLISVAHGDVDGSQLIEVDSGTWRRYLWQAAWPWIERKMAFGYGLSSFKPASTQFFELAVGAGSGAHNVYVQTVFEGGLLLLFSFVYVLLALIVIPFFRITYPGERLFITLIVISYGIVSASDNMLGYLVVNIMLVFVVCALMGSFQHTSRRGMVEHRRPQLLLGDTR